MALSAVGRAGPLAKVGTMLSRRPCVWKVPGKVLLTGHRSGSISQVTDICGGFFLLNVLLDFFLLGCETFSALSLSLPKRGCPLGLLREQFLSYFFKSHH